ncbi:MAG: glycoside hydrolase family 2, partial [Bacteroidetes bacterium]|nr:glycoside hydrolase family 2 [Bacteroidota bacterium]
EAGYEIKQKGKIPSPDIAATKMGSLQLQLPGDYKNYDALVIIAKDNFGKEIYQWITKIKSNKEMLNDLVAMKSDSTTANETDSTYLLKGGDITLVLDKKTGELITSHNITNDYVLSFNNGPMLVEGESKVSSSKIYREGNDVVAEFHYDGTMHYSKWKMNASGWATLEYEYDLQGDYPFAGITFHYPEDYILGAKWLGKGPCRQWKNRIAGTEVNVWQNEYNNTQTGYPPIVYPEFKGYYGEINWMELSTVEGKIYVASPDSGLFVRLFDFYGLTSATKPFPELPSGNISFLDCIPPMGSKLAMGLTTNTKVYGPMSELNHLSGNKKRTLYFYFGLPATTNSKEKYSRPAVDNVFTPKP